VIVRMLKGGCLLIVLFWALLFAAVLWTEFRMLLGHWVSVHGVQ